MLRNWKNSILFTLLLAACAAPREGAEDTWVHRASDFVAPIVPDMIRPGSREPELKASVSLEPASFALAERRDVRLNFVVKNTTKKAVRLEFPTTQRLEVVVRSPEAKTIFLWSEDRLFEPKSSIVIINPGERIVYEASIPTRDMTAGTSYNVEAVLVGYPEVTTTISVKPL